MIIMLQINMCSFLGVFFSDKKKLIHIEQTITLNPHPVSS